VKAFSTLSRLLNSSVNLFSILVFSLSVLAESSLSSKLNSFSSILASNTSLTKQQINSLKEFGNYIERTNSIEGAVSDVLGEGTRHFQGMLSHVRGIALASKVSKSLTQKKLNVSKSITRLLDLPLVILVTSALASSTVDALF
jgi:hypothetical protein